MTIDRRRFLTSSTTAALGASALAWSVRNRAFAGWPPTIDRLDELKKRLGKRLVVPADARYETLRKVRNRAYDGVRPRALVMAQSVDDVRAALQWAAANKVAVVPRCGGHSYIGQSTSDGLVISVLGMSEVRVNKAEMSAEVGAGALNVGANHGLLKEGVALPTGSCPSVGIAGLTLGGGIGFSSRRWGLMIDNLIGATMVLASGEVVEIDDENRPELLWVCRGGGGGHFGVVTSFRFRVHEIEPIAEFTIRWPWAAADRVLDAWQRLAPDAPDALFATCTLARGKSEPQVLSHGRFHGSKAALKKLLAPLIGAARPLRSPQIYDHTLWGSHLKGPKCLPDPSVCHSWNHPAPGRYKQASYTVKSDYFSDLLDEEARTTLLTGFAGIQRQAISWGAVILDPLGGAINRVAPDATAYVHRRHRVQAEYVAHWSSRASDLTAANNREWMRELYRTMRPHASGECYQNYPDLDLADWKRAYFGDNLARLERLKAALDPAGVFRGRQSL